MILDFLPKGAETFVSGISNVGQKANWKWIGKIKNMKIKIIISSDSYQMQSKAVSEVFSEHSLTWNHVYSIPTSLMETKSGLAYHGDWNSDKHFEKDFKNILENTLKILF